MSATNPETAASPSFRPLTSHEVALARWMLEHGTSDAQTFFAQLDRATATTWRCPCGCASYNFLIAGLPAAPPGVQILGDFVYGSNDDLKGVFIYHSKGILSGVELTGYGGNALAELPSTTDLVTVEEYNARVRKS